MSRQNKVNPGMYTQRGRLSQDDGARERAKQRSIGSQRTWQPVQQDATPLFKSKHEDADHPEAAAQPAETPAETTASPARVKAKPAARKTPKPAAKAAVKTKKKTGRTVPVKAKAAVAAKTPNPRAKSGRKAVLARNAAGPAAKPRRSAKRRKS